MSLREAGPSIYWQRTGRLSYICTITRERELLLDYETADGQKRSMAIPPLPGPVPLRREEIGAIYAIGGKELENRVAMLLWQQNMRWQKPGLRDFSVVGF